MIPIYVVTQSGGAIYSMDDPATVNDFAAADGSGGVPFAPYVLSTLFRLDRTLGWYDFRKFRQRADAPSQAIIAVIPWRDGLPTAQTLVKVFPVSGTDITSTPFFISGSSFQVQVVVSGYSRPVELGNASCSFVMRRRTRATGAGANADLVYEAFGPYDGHYTYNGILR